MLYSGRLLVLSANIILGLKNRDKNKHSSLLRTFENYGRKTFCNIGPGHSPCPLNKSPLFLPWLLSFQVFDVNR